MLLPAARSIKSGTVNLAIADCPHVGYARSTAYFPAQFALPLLNCFRSSTEASPNHFIWPCQVGSHNSVFSRHGMNPNSQEPGKEGSPCGGRETRVSVDVIGL